MNELNILPLIEQERDGRRIREFLEDPVISKFFDRLESAAVAQAIEGGSAEVRESHRVHVLVIRNLRHQLKTAIARATAATGQIQKAKAHKA